MKYWGILLRREMNKVSDEAIKRSVSGVEVLVIDMNTDGVQSLKGQTYLEFVRRV